MYSYNLNKIFSYGALPLKPSMLEGKDFDDYIKEIKRDDYMEKYRDFYYIR